MVEFSRPMHVGVVGAGVAGLTAAGVLAEHGHHVVVFDKSRGVGGRTSVRRHGSYSFDHGAQYFTVRTPEFRGPVESMIELGVVAEWTGRIVTTENGLPSSDSTRRFVGVPGMNALCKHLATKLTVVPEKRITRLIQSDADWTLIDDSDGPAGRFDAIVLALPAKQSSELLATAGQLDQRIERCRLEPCWAVLLGFTDALEVPFDGAFVNGSQLSWVARNNSKPGRTQSESWVLHAGPEWSSAHYDLPPEEVIDVLWLEFQRVTGLVGHDPVVRDTHRWRFALPPSPLDQGCILNWDSRWVVCGDWCNGARVEGAFLSGLDAARKLIGAPSAGPHPRREAGPR